MRMFASYWKQELPTEHKYIIQISLPVGGGRLQKLKSIFETWNLTGEGVDPNRKSKIVLFSRNFKLTSDWDSFRREHNLDEVMELEEVK